MPKVTLNKPVTVDKKKDKPRSQQRMVRRWRRNAKSFDSVAEGSVEMGYKDLAETYRMIATTYRNCADELRDELRNSPNDQAEASGARGRPIANPDAPAALPPAHG